MAIYKETISLCAECAKDSPAHYEESADGMWLFTDCSDHGQTREKVENDAAFFKWGYEQDYAKNYAHLILPITYRCNLNCKYCYTLSNAPFALPGDRSFAELARIIEGFDGNITLIGGEPTIRDDLLELIGSAKINRRRKISLGTNGQKLKDMAYVKGLKEAGLDFVFLSLNDVAYEGSAIIRKNKITALSNCQKLRLPVWLHQTIDDLKQLDSLFPVVAEYGKTIFNMTIRAVKPFGLIHPETEFFVSDILKYLGADNAYSKGFSFFNRQISLGGIPAKICSWVNDVARLDPIDSRYLISDGTMTAFHRGMKMDEVLILGRNRPRQRLSSGSS